MAITLATAPWIVLGMARRDPSRLHGLRFAHKEPMRTKRRGATVLCAYLDEDPSFAKR